jgi:hypothetical protein
MLLEDGPLAHFRIGILPYRPLFRLCCVEADCALIVLVFGFCLGAAARIDIYGRPAFVQNGR